MEDTHPARLSARLCSNTIRGLLAAMSVVTACAIDISSPDEVPRTLSGLIDKSEDIQISRCPADQQIIAVYSESEPSWWGRLAVYRRNGDAIDWRYSYPKDFEGGHFVVRFRWIKLKQTSKPVLEVIDSTHMGNGFLRLFEVHDRELRLLLSTKVSGRFWSPPPVFGVPEDAEANFERDLTVDYRESANGGADSVVLTGSVRISDMEDKLLPSRRFEQICVWDVEKRVFVAQTPTSP